MWAHDTHIPPQPQHTHLYIISNSTSLCSSSFSIDSFLKNLTFISNILCDYNLKLFSYVYNVLNVPFFAFCFSCWCCLMLMLCIHKKGLFCLRLPFLTVSFFSYLTQTHISSIFACMSMKKSHKMFMCTRNVSIYWRYILFLYGCL